MNLDDYENLQDYLTNKFSKSGRYKLKKYNKRFNHCYDVTYTMYYGGIDKESYSNIFNAFRALLEKRFVEKRISNNNLETAEWEFYKDTAYPMILNKEAALFVIHADDKPVAVTLNYIHGNKIIDAITVFDIDYAKFNLGYINFMNLIEWCIANKFEVLDFSKGYFDYKKRWGNHQYSFEYHVLYDKNHLPSILLAFGLTSFFKLKQRLREKNVNTLMQKLKHVVKKSSKKNVAEYGTTILESLPENDTIKSVIKEEVIEQPMIKSHIYSFQYLHTLTLNQIKFYVDANQPKSFYLETKGQVLNIFIK